MNETFDLKLYISCLHFFLRQNAYYLVHIVLEHLKLLAQLNSRHGISIQQSEYQKQKEDHFNYSSHSLLQKI